MVCPRHRRFCRTSSPLRSFSTVRVSLIVRTAQRTEAGACARWCSVDGDPERVASGGMGSGNMEVLQTNRAIRWLGHRELARSWAGDERGASLSGSGSIGSTVAALASARAIASA